jgi:hypothetical protein
MFLPERLSMSKPRFQSLRVPAIKKCIGASAPGNLREVSHRIEVQYRTVREFFKLIFSLLSRKNW